MEGAEAADAFPYRELRDGDINALHAWLSRGGQIDAPLLSSVAETWTPLMLACAEGDPHLARTIVQSGGACASARVGTKVLASPAPLHVAARYGYVAVVRTLLDLGAAVDARDTVGMTPLHYGAGHGHMKVAQVGASVFRRHNRGRAVGWGYTTKAMKVSASRVTNHVHGVE